MMQAMFIHDPITQVQESNSEFDRAESFQGKSGENINFELTKTGKSINKTVSFAKASKTKKTVTKVFQTSETSKSGTNGKEITRKNLGEAADDFKHDEMNKLLSQLNQFRERTQEVQGKLTNEYAIEDPKLLEIIMEHILLHWDEIVVCLIDELIEEEVLELNKVENIRTQRQPKPHLADRSMSGKFHDYKSIDLREITKIFEEYDDAERAIKRFTEL